MSLSKALTSKQTANKVAQFADDMKAQDIVILHMSNLVNFCDYFVIATGTSDRHALSIAEGIQHKANLLGISVNLGKSLKGFSSTQSGQEQGAWVLLDMGDVVAHVFEPSARDFYALEHLWQDAPVTTYKKRRTVKKTK